MVARVALLLLESLGLGELRRVELAQEFAFELAKQLALANEQPCFEQAGLDGHVLGGEFGALGDRAHAVPDVEPDVPQQADELFEFFRQRLVGGGRQQYQEVDVGIREQLAAAVTADRDKGNARGHVDVLPNRFQDAVDELAMLAQQLRRGVVFEIALVQRGAIFGEPPLQPRAGRFRHRGCCERRLCSASHARR